MPSPFLIDQTHARSTFDRAVPPVLEVEPGSIVTFECGAEAYQRIWRGALPESIADDEFNLVTGPVAVRGAEPGQALRVDILQIEIQQAWAVWLPGFGPLGHLTERAQVQPVPIADGRLRLSERLSVPLEPMIGCIGVAPADGYGSTLEPAYRFGGNLDLRELSPGASLFLPVQVSGGLLSIGDLHAAMGTGEPTWVSIEAAGKATLRIELQKNLHLTGPRVRIGTTTICVAVLGKDGTLEEASEQAIRLAFEFLTNECALSPFEAYAYISARVELRFGGPASAMVLAAIPDLI